MLFPLPPSLTPESPILQTPEERGYQNCQCQVIRSVDYWSAGVPQTESSVYRAMIVSFF
jgi:hypothetical protein